MVLFVIRDETQDENMLFIFLMPFQKIIHGADPTGVFQNLKRYLSLTILLWMMIITMGYKIQQTLRNSSPPINMRMRNPFFYGLNIYQLVYTNEFPLKNELGAVFLQINKKNKQACEGNL
jgi:hypothetical protein